MSRVPGKRQSHGIEKLDAMLSPFVGPTTSGWCVLLFFLTSRYRTSTRSNDSSYKIVHALGCARRRDTAP